jgi:hypothetical protein
MYVCVCVCVCEGPPTSRETCHDHSARRPHSDPYLGGRGGGRGRLQVRRHRQPPPPFVLAHTESQTLPVRGARPTVPLPHTDTDTDTHTRVLGSRGHVYDLVLRCGLTVTTFVGTHVCEWLL